jgi:RhoGAP domain
VTARLVVTNDGRVPVSLSISRDRFPAWLSLCDPRQQTISALDPKDSVGIMFQALVTAQSGCSAALGCGEQKLEVSLYVRVNGVDGIREDFEIKGRYIQTCLGTTLDVLAMCLEPLQLVRAGEAGHRDREHDESEYRAGQSPVPLPMPKEIWWLVDLLWRKRTVPHTESMEVRGTWRWIDRDSRLFLATGDLEMVEVVQECIDTGSPVPEEVDGLATASCLLRLLRSLEEPVIPFTAYSSALEAGKSRDPAAVTALLAKISPLHCNVFQYIVRLAREMSSVRDGSAVQEIAEIFGEALLSPDKSRTGRDMRERAAFMRLALKVQKDAPYAIMVVDIARSSLYHGGKSRSPHHAHHQHRGAVEQRHDSRHEHRQEYRHELGPL